jgi:hypothetical protein
VLAGVFGVEVSYLLDRGEPPLLDKELAQALRDEHVREISRESSRLPDGERRLVLGIVRQFRDQKAAPSGYNYPRCKDVKRTQSSSPSLHQAT